MTSSDLKVRVAEHNKGAVESTRSYIPLKLVYYEAYLSERDARNREFKLKHHGSVIGHFKEETEGQLGVISVVKCLNKSQKEFREGAWPRPFGLDWNVYRQ